MDRERLTRHRLRNQLHSIALLGAMVGLLALIGDAIFGTPGLTVAVVVGIALFSLGPRLSPQWVLRMYRARPLGPAEAPQLWVLVRELARRAELPAVPRLYYVPSRALNAFAVGRADDSAIAVTDGILRRLGGREIAGALAHEISHIRHHDLQVMALADVVSRITRSFSLLGQIALLLMLLAGYPVPWLPMILLIFAPTVSSLLQLALSRTRELEADRGAVELTGDPQGLASALAKLEASQVSWLRILFPRRSPETSILRSHPDTEERIRRLRSLASPRPVEGPVPVTFTVEPRLLDLLAPRVRRPRRHVFSGLWF